ncbi:Dihydrolipoyllysine-residue acetyltransferase component 1 of pyruvate dehydrogenase complex [Chlorella vulgaris]
MRRSLQALRRRWIAAGEFSQLGGCRSLQTFAGTALLRPTEAASHRPAFWAGSSLAARCYSSLPPTTELCMPALSPTMSSGNLVAWHVKEGQLVAPGDVIADVETDKATLSWENQDDGYVAKLLVPEGAKDLAVGSPVALLVEEEDQVAAFKDYVPTAGGAPAAVPAAEPEAAAAAGAGADEPAAAAGQHNSRMGPAARSLLAESGIPAGLVTPTGPRSIITKGDVLAAIAAGVKAPAAAAPPPPPPQQQQKQPEAAAPSRPAASPPAAAPQPAAAKQAAAAPPQPAPAGAGYTDIPNSQIRKIIAQRLLESKQTIPHLYVSADVDLDGVSALRAALKQQGVKVSVNDCVIKAAALALAEVPAANALWDAAAEAPKAAGGVDIAVAVATDTGLITPIIRGADAKPLPQIAAEVRELAGRARAGRLRPEEFQGGSFSISNLGMFGVDEFSAIINPPQACIMAVGGSRQVAYMKEGLPASKAQMTVTLSADNRVYDGEVASAFLSAFSRHMGNPFRMYG